MTYQLWLFFTAIIQTNLQYVRSDDRLNDDVTCVMTYDDWISPAWLRVNWTIPPLTAEPEDLNVNITWYTVDLIGSCPEVKPTSCTWDHGHPMSFSYDFDVNVSVTITEKGTEIFNREWEVNPDDCRKPPSVDHVIADPVNSTCVNISWWYNEKSKCSNFDSKFYQLSFGKKNGKEFKVYDPANKTLVTACHSNRILCNLQPFTKYVFNIQVKVGDWADKVRGHFSHSKLATCVTPEDVPAGAPGVARGGFSSVENKCTSENIRTVRIYWKDVPSDLKHGHIIHFLIDIQSLPEGESPVTQIVQGNSYNSLVTLNCSTEYEIRLKAETSVGVSSVYSSLFIPETPQGSQSAIENVIPIIAKDSFRVYWLEDTEVRASQTQEYRVFWCFKDVNSQCMSPINWTKVPENSSYAEVLVQPGSLPHRYLFGVGYGDAGITWSNCHYTDTEDLRPPVGLKWKSDDSSPYGSVTIFWDSDPCESHPPSPFIDQFVVSICKVKDSNGKICKAEPSKRVVDDKRNSYLFTDLDPSAVYMVCVHTIGMSRKHHGNSSCINGQPAGHRSAWSWPLVAVCVIVAVILLSCAIYGWVKCNERLMRKLRLCKERFRITIPDDILELDGQHITSISLTDTSQRPLITKTINHSADNNGPF